MVDKTMTAEEMEDDYVLMERYAERVRKKGYIVEIKMRRVIQ